MNDTRICAYSKCNNELPPDAPSRRKCCCARCSDLHYHERIRAKMVRLPSAGQDLEDISIAAKAAGMTYGEYIARKGL